MVLRKGTDRVQKWPSGDGGQGTWLVAEVFWGSCHLGDLHHRFQVCSGGECRESVPLREHHEQGGMGVGLGLGPGRMQRSQAGRWPWALAVEEDQGSPRLWALMTSLASQEPQLLGAGSSVISCLLEGPVRLGAGSVLQHCHLQVRSESRGRARSRLWGPGPVCVGGVPVLPTRDACSLPC